jgi:SAM-dependent methyltransferase
MMRLPGAELALDPTLSTLERTYVRLLGAPISGLRIRLRRVLPLTRGRYRRILDAGCGVGVFTMELAKQHPEAQVLGVDMEPALVERASDIAKRAGLSNCHFAVEDVTRLPYREEFDLVVSVDNLEHVEADVAAMENLRTVLVPGGTLVVHVPGYYRRWLFFGRRVNFHVPGHMRPGYTAAELTEKLRRAGLEVLDHQYTYGALETITNNISYLISGAERQNRHVYAAVFPLLLVVSYFGQFSRPSEGAGVMARARRSVAALVDDVGSGSELMSAKTRR